MTPEAASHAARNVADDGSLEERLTIYWHEFCGNTTHKRGPTNLSNQTMLEEALNLYRCSISLYLNSMYIMGERPRRLPTHHVILGVKE